MRSVGEPSWRVRTPSARRGDPRRWSYGHVRECIGMCGLGVATPTRDSPVERQLVDGVSTWSDDVAGRCYANADVVDTLPTGLDDGDDACPQLGIRPLIVVVYEDTIARPQRVPLERQHHCGVFGSSAA